MKLSEKIISLRKAQGLSQEELAQKIHVSRQAVSRWETDGALPDASNVLQLSRLFGVTADFLLNDGQECALESVPGQEKVRCRKKLGLCVSALGLLGNFVIYILSRYEEVMIPHITYENGEKWYHWSSELTGYSYKYYIWEHNLELLTALFWLLAAGGLAAAFMNWETVKKWLQR